MSNTELLEMVQGLFPELDIHKELGQGAEGAVFYGVSLHSGTEIALKILTKQEEDAQRRFLREGKILEQLDHPHVVKIYEYGKRAQTYFQKLEFCAYESLLYKIAKEGLGDKEAGTIMVQIADAIDYIHGQNILHRDLKPENIMMTADGEPKVVDFGLAFCAGDDLSKLIAIGSAGYAAPEIWSTPERVSIQTDVYALGATLYTILTNVLPDPHNVNFNHLYDRDKLFIPIILKSMNQEPAKRYKSAKLFGDSVQNVVDRHGQPPEIWW